MHGARFFLDSEYAPFPHSARYLTQALPYKVTQPDTASQLKELQALPEMPDKVRREQNDDGF
jgi:hypothetical protein